MSKVYPGYSALKDEDRAKLVVGVQYDLVRPLCVFLCQGRIHYAYAGPFNCSTSKRFVEI